MSKAKATSRFRLLQGQDATNASPGELEQYLDEEQSLFLAGERLQTLMMMWRIQPRMIWHLMWNLFFEADEWMHSPLMFDEGPTSRHVHGKSKSEDPITMKRRTSYDSNSILRYKIMIPL
ncbi:hypothetical protein Tco_0799287 [Tanacetum coccineum]